MALTFEPAAVEYIQQRYASERVPARPNTEPSRFLVDTILPSDRLALSGEGAVIQTSHGELIDFQSMTVNCILGQNDPWVKLQQMAYLASDRPSFHTTRLGSELYFSLPQRLVDMSLANIEDGVVSHRQCNGSDAVEHAIKAAFTAHPDKSTIVSYCGSYHGQNLTAYLMSDVQSQHRFLAGQVPVVFLDAPDSAASVQDDPPLSDKEKRDLDYIGTNAGQIAAVIVEPIQMNNGVRPYSRSYLAALTSICRERDVCVIFDEVQTGFGWLGEMSMAQHYGVRPDIAAFGKALTAGNGPLALTISTGVYHKMPSGTATKTSGADVRSLVAAHAVLDRLLGVPDDQIPDFLSKRLARELQTGLLASVPALAMQLWDGLTEIRRRNPEKVREVRGGGLMCGLELRPDGRRTAKEMTVAVMDECFSRGLFLRTSKDSVVIKIPLVIEASQLEHGLQIMNDVVRDV